LAAVHKLVWGIRSTAREDWFAKGS